MTSKYDTDIMPHTDLLRVCLSCWRRVPTHFSRTILRHRFPATSPLVCSGHCGQRWTSLLGNSCSHREMSSSEKPEKDELSSNPFFSKYKEKLKHMQKEDPEEFDARVEEMKEQKKTKQTPPGPQPVPSPPEPHMEVPKSSPDTSGFKSWPPKSLDEVMKVDLVKDLPADTIKQLWQERHLEKDCVFAVVPALDYDEVMTKSALNPMFLFTLPKGDGYEFYLCQFNGKDVYFTPLSMYQLLKENAPPCLSLAHFPELKDSKGIVLMAGEYDDKIIKKTEALNLVKQMTLYYGKDAGDRYKLLRTFNLKPEEFNYMDIVEQYKQNQQFLEHNPY